MIINGKEFDMAGARDQSCVKIHEQGDVRFIFRSVLIAVVIVCLGETGFGVLKNHLSVGDALLHSIESALIAAFIGWISGSLEWDRNEKRYLSLTQQRDSVSKSQRELGSRS